MSYYRRGSDILRSATKALPSQRSLELPPPEEEALLRLAVNEYRDLFPLIISLSQSEFINKLESYVLISLNKNINFAHGTISKIINIVKTEYYNVDYIRINKIIQSLSVDKINTLSRFTTNNFISHCNISTPPYHSCGEYLYIITNKWLLCLKCKLLYHRNCVLLHCSHCNINYYTKIDDGPVNANILRPVALMSYHCEDDVHIPMKCDQCHEVLYTNVHCDKLLCLRCNTSTAISQCVFTCRVCRTNFSSLLKPFNPLSEKSTLLAMKEALLNRVEAKPEFLMCCNLRKEDAMKMRIVHKKECNGILYEGEVDNRKIVVCAKCHMVNYSDSFMWYCPRCKIRIKMKKGICVNRKITTPLKQEIQSTAAKRKNSTILKDINLNDFEDNSKHFRMRHGSCEIKNVMTEGNQTTRGAIKDFSMSPLKKKMTSYYSKAQSPDNKRRSIISLLDNHINNININFNVNVNIAPNVVQNENFNVDDYTITKQLGEGTFGKIYEVVNEKGEMFAMKKILTSNIDDISSIKKEYEMLKSLSSLSLNLVNILAIETKQLDKTTYVLYVLMDKANCDWEKELERRRNKKIPYTENELIEIISQLIKTFAELQRHNISHRDIKPQNILLFNDGSFRIGDFGEAKALKKNSTDTIKQTIRGTELYMSPVLFRALKEKQNDKYTEHNCYKSDVYSLGLCLILAATLTFNSLVDIRELNDMLSMKIALSKYLKGYSMRFKDIIYKMIEIDEKKRCDFIELEKYIKSI